MSYKSYGTVPNAVIVLPNDEERLPLLTTFERNIEQKSCKFLGIEKPSFLFTIYVLVYIMFLFSGAAVFSVLESTEDRALRVALDAKITDFLKAHPSVSDQALENLITEIVKANNRGVSATRNVSGESNWSFGQSLFFSGTVVTTIGYGHVTPLSRTGKMFCILYAVVGIPLTLVLLSALVARLLVPTIWVLQWLNSRLGHLYQPLNIRVLHLFLIVAILVIVFLLVPAAVFSSIEPDWDYLDSIYYCFISLTTIGLGDYIPGDTDNQPYRTLYKIVTTVYLFLGITFMMLALAVFYDIPQLNIGLLFTTNEETNSEKVRLAGSGLGLQYGANYSPSNDENPHRQVVRVRSRRTDSPSPEEPLAGKEFRLP